MRVAIALAAVAVIATCPGCKFAPGGGASTDDATPPTDDSGAIIDAPVMMIDAPSGDANMGLDASTGTPLLLHDFENSLIGPFTNVYELMNDSVNQSSTAHTGSKSAICTSQSPAPAQATMYLDVSDRDQLYASMWLRLGAGFPPTDYVMVMAFVDTSAGWANVAQVAVFSDMRVGIYNNATGMNYYSTTKLTTNTWYRIEALTKVSTTGGRLMLAINGVVQVNATGIDTGALQLDKILTGLAWQGVETDPTTLYIDDIRIE